VWGIFRLGEGNSRPAEMPLYLIEAQRQELSHVTGLLDAMMPAIVSAAPSTDAMVMLSGHINHRYAYGAEPVQYVVELPLATPGPNPVTAVSEADQAAYMVPAVTGAPALANETDEQTERRVREWWQYDFAPHWEQTPNLAAVIVADTPVFLHLFNTINARSPVVFDLVTGPPRRGSIVAYRHDGVTLELNRQLQ
jgi:hypothetical protein